MAAAFTTALPPVSARAKMNAGPQQAGLLHRLRQRVSRSLRALYIQDIIDEINMRDLHARYAQRVELARPLIPSQAELAAAAFADERENGAGQSGGLRENSGGTPQSVCVAVLIAMPDPVYPTYMERETWSEEGSLSMPEADGNGKATNETKKELPYLEFGLAEVSLSPRSHNTTA